MKLALCFYGRIDMHDYILYEKSFDTFKENVIRNNDCDIFMHGWDDKGINKNKILNLVKPKEFKIEKITESNNIKSRWLSHKKVLDMLYDTNYEYDFIFISRLDLYFKTSFNFESYSTGQLYIENWSPDEIKRKDIVKKCGLADLWFFGCQKIIKQIKNIYDDIDKLQNYIKNSNHLIIYNFLIDNNINYILIRNIIKDTNLTRRITKY